ncbi:MAG: DNA-binding protein [Henriciella sp.]|uniref:DNA-binding protein n=1 Tax=Henriciella sp. TaxID=1968823 RepID=UPI003C7739F8
MSKHEKKFEAEPGLDQDYLRRTETAILAFMAENEGKMPTLPQVHAEVKGSYTKLCPAVRAVKQRLLATETRLANTPEIPDELRLIHEQQLKEMWTKARALQNDEIVDLRRSQAAKDERHRNDMAEAQEVIAIVEAGRNGECKRADEAEATVIELQEKLNVAEKALAEANARLAERESLFAMLSSMQRPADDGQTGSKEAKPTRSARKSDEPETGDLPMPAGPMPSKPSGTK